MLPMSTASPFSRLSGRIPQEQLDTFAGVRPSCYGLRVPSRTETGRPQLEKPEKDSVAAGKAYADCEGGAADRLRRRCLLVQPWTPKGFGKPR